MCRLVFICVNRFIYRGQNEMSWAEICQAGRRLAKAIARRGQWPNGWGAENLRLHGMLVKEGLGSLK